MFLRPSIITCVMGSYPVDQLKGNYNDLNRSKL